MEVWFGRFFTILQRTLETKSVLLLCRQWSMGPWLFKHEGHTMHNPREWPQRGPHWCTARDHLRLPYCQQWSWWHRARMASWDKGWRLRCVSIGTQKPMDGQMVISGSLQSLKSPDLCHLGCLRCVAQTSASGIFQINPRTLDGIGQVDKDEKEQTHADIEFACNIWAHMLDEPNLQSFRGHFAGLWAWWE